MAEPIIRTERLSKRYRLQRPLKHDHLREAIAAALKTPFRSRQKQLSTDSTDQYLWALRDLNLEIKEGEVLGVIGRNGAGKSTLLKILSRITEPTSGQILLKGRVSSLLDVGTGFHPDLSGRENIHLNAAILGMSRAEIRRKFDEIVEFSGIERFLDMPVKRYSSGMYVRLAFAVAAHLDSDILLIDEVLAVGDYEFQKKCMHKIDDIAHSRRTILFVSHNLGAIERLCNRTIVINAGEKAFDGATLEAIRYYSSLHQKQTLAASLLAPEIQRTGKGDARFSKVEIRCADQPSQNPIHTGDDISISLVVDVYREVKNLRIAVYVKNTVGLTLFRLDNANLQPHRDHFPQSISLCCNIKKLPLLPGNYYLNLWLADQIQSQDAIEHACDFVIVPQIDTIIDHVKHPLNIGLIHTAYTWEIV